MRKIISILLLFTLSFSIYGYHMFFGVQTARAKCEMKQFLKMQKHHADVVVFHFTAAEAQTLEWEEEHEFRFQGKMYDVVDQIIEGGKITIRCIQDENETSLLNQFLKTTKNRQRTSVIQLLISPFVLPHIEMPQPAERPLSVNLIRLSFYFDCPDVFILTPPPRQV